MTDVGFKQPTTIRRSWYDRLILNIFWDISKTQQNGHKLVKL